MPDNDKIQRGEEIRNMLKAFSEKHLADELYGYCIRLLEKLVRKRTVSIAKGKPEIWAASIVHVIARLNFLFDKANPCFLTADTICGFFGCSKSTVSSKSTDIEKVCRIRMGDAQLCRPEISDSLTIVQLPNGMVATKEMLRHWEDSGPLDIVVELADSETSKEILAVMAEKERQQKMEEQKRIERRAEIKRQTADEKKKKQNRLQLSLFDD